MRLYLLPSWYNNEQVITLTGKDYNYLVNALRLKTNQNISARDRNGNLYMLTIVSIDKKSCTLNCNRIQNEIATTDVLPQDRPVKPLVLYQCIPKGRKADEIIKRATEIGVVKIVLAKSRNCVADLTGKEESRLERYDSIITEAVQQSGSVVPTSVEGIIDISEVPAHFSNLCRNLGINGCGIVLHQCRLRENQNSLFETVRGFNGAVGIAVGPEGGFTDDECDALLKEGFKAVLLKTNILRCETASIYAVSAVQTIVESTCW